MQPQWYGILLAGWIAGCTSSSPTEGPKALPDRFESNLDVLVRSTEHPCGSELDVDGDGQVDVRYTYTYDALGRSQRDVGIDTAGDLYEQIDYTWDNAGHLTEQRSAVPLGIDSDEINVFDTLGRQTQYRLRNESGDHDPASPPRTQTTIDYSNFDVLGHAAHGDQRYEDLIAGTTQMLTRSYGYDNLGRRISLEVRFDSGDLFQDWKHVYDDVAHTVTTTMTSPRSLSGRAGSGITDVSVDTYDAGGHLLTTHDVVTPIEGPQTTTISDTVNVWSGDRQLSSTMTLTVPGFQLRTVKTYQYTCDSARAVTASRAASARGIE